MILNFNAVCSPLTKMTNFDSYFMFIFPAARNLIEAKRPVEYDRRMKPTTDINSGSYG